MPATTPAKLPSEFDNRRLIPHEEGASVACGLRLTDIEYRRGRVFVSLEIIPVAEIERRGLGMAGIETQVTCRIEDQDRAEVPGRRRVVEQHPLAEFGADAIAAEELETVDDALQRKVESFHVADDVGLDRRHEAGADVA